MSHQVRLELSLYLSDLSLINNLNILISDHLQFFVRWCREEAPRFVQRTSPEGKCHYHQEGRVQEPTTPHREGPSGVSRQNTSIACLSFQIILFYRIPSYVAAEKTLAAQMTKLNPNWRIFLMDVQVNNNPNETADGVTIIDLSDD